MTTDEEYARKCEEKLAAIGNDFMSCFDDDRPIVPLVKKTPKSKSKAADDDLGSISVKKNKKKKKVAAVPAPTSPVAPKKKSQLDDWSSLIADTSTPSTPSTLPIDPNVDISTLSKRQQKKLKKQQNKIKMEEEKIAEQEKIEKLKLIEEKKQEELLKKKIRNMPREKKCDFMSGDVNRQKKKPLTGKERTDAFKEAVSEKKDFNETLRAVMDFVMPKMEKHQRKQWEAQKIRALGGKLEKTPHEPYRLIRQRAEKRKTRVADLKRQEEELGVKLTVNRGMNAQQALRKSEKAKKEFEKRKKQGHILSKMGFEKAGELKVRKSIVKKYD